MSVGKSSFMHAVFLLLLGLISMGIGLGTIPFQDMKNPQSLCQAYHIVWEYLCFVLFSLMNYLILSLLKVCMSCGTWPILLLHLSCDGRGQGSSYCGTKGVHVSSCPVMAAWKHLLAMWDHCSLLKLILLCLFSVWVRCISIQWSITLCFPW